MLKFIFWHFHLKKKKITRLYKSLFIVTVGSKYRIIMPLVGQNIFTKAFLTQWENRKDRKLVERKYK